MTSHPTDHALRIAPTEIFKATPIRYIEIKSSALAAEGED